MAELGGAGSRGRAPGHDQASILAAGSLHPLPRDRDGDSDGPVDFVSVEQHSVPLPDHDISVADYVRERAGRGGAGPAGRAIARWRLCRRPGAAVVGGGGGAVEAARRRSRRGGRRRCPNRTARQSSPASTAAWGGCRPRSQLACPTSAPVSSCAGWSGRRPVVGCGHGCRRRTRRRRGRGHSSAGDVAAAGRGRASARPSRSPTSRCASVVIVTFVFDRDLDLPGSGFLVSPSEPVTIKASTFSSNKWGWLKAPGRTVLRASMGRAGEPLLYDDATMTELALADLRARSSGTLPSPVASHVQRWGGGLPQYAVGHLEMLDTIDCGAGASFRGWRLPAPRTGASASRP